MLLRSSKGFNVADVGNAIDVRGGTGGTQTGFYVAPFGGNGGLGYARTEDPNGGVALPGATQGVFDPVGGGVPSVAYSKWADLGVDGPRILNSSADDVGITALNDCAAVEVQFAIEDPAIFGEPLLDAVTATQDTSNPDEVSEWMPLRVVDNTGTPGGAIPLDGWDPDVQGNDVVFDIAEAVDGKGFKFVRVRVTFQLDETQSSSDPLPFVERVVINFQFNF